MLRPLRRPLPFLLVCLTLIAILGIAVRGRNALTRFDADTVASVAGDRSPTIVDVARVVTHLGDALWGALLLLVVGLVLWTAGRLRPLAAFLPVVSMEVGALASLAAKEIVQRPRPPAALHEVVERSTGFPSGHSTQSAAGWIALGLVLALTARPGPTASESASAPARGWIAAGVAVTVLVGMSRVVLGVHSPSDVVAGWILGTLCAVLVVGAALRGGRLGRPDGAQRGSGRPGDGAQRA